MTSKNNPSAGNGEAMPAITYTLPRSGIVLTIAMRGDRPVMFGGLGRAGRTAR